MSHLKDKSYYEDLHDRHTVEECRATEKGLRKFDKPLTAKDEKAISPEEQKEIVKLTERVSMYFLTGERYAQKEKTIHQWMKRDQERDDKLAGAMEPEALCAKCSLEMEYIFRDLHDFDNQEKVLFFFTCPSCKSHRAFFDNGEEYKPPLRLCSHCQTELTVKNSRRGTKIISIYSCVNCDFKKKETFDLSVKSSEEKPDPNFEKDKARFCLSEKEGEKYIQEKHNLEQLTAMREKAEEREKNKEIYDTVAKIKKLTVQDLQKLLTPILNRNRYVKLNLSQPRIEKRVTIDFTVQDANSERDEYDSRKELRKIINKSLHDVNWNLMSYGINYRLGVLSGSLRGYEDEEDLVKLVKSRNKKK